MKTIVVLSALAVAAIAGPALPDDATDFEGTKALKRSPTFGKHHAIGIPVHVPVHHTYVQPVIPHHLGLKKPLLFHNHHGHHGHLYRDDEEQLEARSEESKETKNKCMKDMKAKCEDEFSAKSSEFDGTNIEDIDDNISETDVAQSLQMAKEAVDTLQKKLQKVEKNSRMSQWKNGEVDSDLKLRENVEVAKQALDHMQLNFGNMESMKVHATTFKDSGVHDVHLELGKSEQERLSQWKDAIENIQKNVELVKNIEDSFKENSEMKTFEKSSDFKQAKSEGHQSIVSNFSDKRTSEIIENQKSDMASSASTMSESMTSQLLPNNQHEQSSRSENSQSGSKHEISSQDSLHKMKSNTDLEPLGVVPVATGKKLSAQGLQIEDNDHTMSKSMTSFQKSNNQNEQSFRSESSQSETKEDISKQSSNTMNSNTAFEPLGVAPVVTGKKMTVQGLQTIEDKKEDAKQKKLASSPTKTMKSSDIEDIQLSNLEQEKSVPIDTTALMKSAEHSHADHNAADSPKNTDHLESKSEIEQKRGSHVGSSSDSIHKNPAQDNLMHSHDQITGQSHHSEMMAKPMQHNNHHSEKSDHLNSFDGHGKSAEGSFSSQTGLNTGFKSPLDVPKTWKDASLKDGASRSAYGYGVGLGSGYGAGGGHAAGGGAVGVFPRAHVGGCAIPLLLSCSPSVVAGSLAKAHPYSAPSYAAPAYRSTDNANTQTKRDITKLATPSKAKPIKNLKQKPILITNKLF